MSHTLIVFHLSYSTYRDVVPGVHLSSVKHRVSPTAKHMQRGRRTRFDDNESWLLRNHTFGPCQNSRKSFTDTKLFVFPPQWKNNNSLLTNDQKRVHSQFMAPLDTRSREKTSNTQDWRIVVYSPFVPAARSRDANNFANSMAPGATYPFDVPGGTSEEDWKSKRIERDLLPSQWLVRCDTNRVVGIAPSRTSANFQNRSNIKI